MSFHVKDDFGPKMPVAAVGADWYNKVGGFINALVAGTALKMEKPERPSVSAPVIIDIDPDVVREIANQPPSGGEAVELLTSKGLRDGDAVNDVEWNTGSKAPVSFQVVSRIVNVGGIAFRFYLREMSLDSTGRVTSISKEVGYFEVISCQT